MSTPAVDLNAAPYSESDEHVPNPTDIFGTLDTSATAGAADSKIETVTPIFEVAQQQDALTAAAALDPENKDTPESLVVLPDNNRTNEEAREVVSAKAKAAEDEPVVVGGLSPYQRQAAEETGKDGAETAQAQQATQASTASVSTTSPSDTGRQTNSGKGKQA